MSIIKRWQKICCTIAMAGVVLLGTGQGTEAQSALFTDMPSTHWAYETVMWAKAAGITDGYPDGTFRPSKSVTESEFLAMLLRAYPEIQLDEKKEQEVWYNPYYKLAAELHWTVYDNPSGAISRGQAVQLMTDVMGKDFTEKEAIRFVLSEGIAQGKKGPGMEGFAPDDPLSRAETQTFLYRMKQQLPQISDSKVVIPGIELEGVQVGDSVAKVVQLLGEPDRKDVLNKEMQWYIYKGNYTNYKQIGIMEGKVIALFSNGTGWKFSNKEEIRLADLSTQGEQMWGTGETVDNVIFYTPRKMQIKLFTDSHEKGRIDGVFVTSKMEFDLAQYMEVTEDTLKSYEQEIFDLTNVFRVSKGLQPLLWNEQAAESARLHSADMAARNFFDHTNPDGKTPGDRMAAQGLAFYRAWGENIAAGHTNAIDAHYGWINSLGHRKAMLNSTYSWLGVGVKEALGSSKYGMYYTQNFFTPR